MKSQLAMLFILGAGFLGIGLTISVVAMHAALVPPGQLAFDGILLMGLCWSIGCLAASQVLKSPIASANVSFLPPDQQSRRPLRGRHRSCLQASGASR